MHGILWVATDTNAMARRTLWGMGISSIYSRLTTTLAKANETMILADRVSWWEYGDPAAPPIIMVHGFRGDHHGLEPIAINLANNRVIIPDLPGFGKSARMSNKAQDLQGYTEWLKQFIAHAVPRTSYTLLGHSFGSIVAASAVASGAEPERLILVNPIGAPALAGPRGIMTRLAVFYYKLSAVLPERVGLALLRNSLVVRIMSVTMAKTKDPELRRFIHDQHDRYFSIFADRDGLLEAFKTSVTHDVREFAPNISAPTLLIAADRDDITPITAQHRLVKLFSRAELKTVSGVGHLIHYEAPKLAADMITQFMQGSSEVTDEDRF